MNISHFPNFYRTFFKDVHTDGNLLVLTDEDLLVLGKEFDTYLKSLNLPNYEEITAIEPLHVSIRMKNPVMEGFGYHHDLIIYFLDFLTKVGGACIKAQVIMKPEHYTAKGKECIVEMYEKFGHEAVKNFCQLNAFKYNYRQDHKGQSDLDIAKAKWYEVVYDQLSDGKNVHEALAFVRWEFRHES